MRLFKQKTIDEQLSELGITYIRLDNGNNWLDYEPNYSYAWHTDKRPTDEQIFNCAQILIEYQNKSSSRSYRGI